MFGKKKKNNPSRIHSVGEERKEYSPSDENEKKLTAIFNELLGRSDYKKFDYQELELKTPHQSSIGKPDVPAEHFTILKTRLYHYAVTSASETYINRGESYVMTRIIKSFNGREVSRSFEFADNILTLDGIPKPDLKRIEQQQQQVLDNKDKLAKQSHARFVVRAQGEHRRDTAERYLRSRSFSFHNGSSTEELEQLVKNLKEAEKL